MLNSHEAPAWIAKILRQLVEAEFVELSMVVRNDEAPMAQPRLSRLRAVRAAGSFSSISTVASTNGCSAPSRARLRPSMLPISRWSGWIEDASRSAHRPRPYEHRFPPEAVERIRAADLDVLLRFGFNIIRGEIQETAQSYGVWSYHHGDNREYRGQPDFFWEMYEPPVGDRDDAPGARRRARRRSDPLPVVCRHRSDVDVTRQERRVLEDRRVRHPDAGQASH